MEAGAPVLLLLVSVSLGSAGAQGFYGDSISFLPPQKNSDGTFRVTFYHRQNGWSTCQDQSASPVKKGSAPALISQVSCKRIRMRQAKAAGANLKDTQQQLCQPIKPLFLSGSGCCWVSNVNGQTNWTSEAELDLGTRSDSQALNRCPVTTAVSALRVPQNCFSVIHLLAHDPDDDIVRCRFSPDAPVPSNFTLDEMQCTLTSAGQISTGVQVFEVLLEDFPTTNITLTYADGTSASREASDINSPPLCRVKLQFSVEILHPIPSCEAGHVQPMFLSQTPSHGDVLYATMGQTFQLQAQAQAHHASIHDFQLSGPQNMSKELRDDESGLVELTVSWTPQPSDLFRFVPICFTAETNESQSEMRCVVVTVTKASIIQGKAKVECSTNMMRVVLDKASMPDIDENFLKLSDPSCSLSSNNTHIMGSMSYSTCGTKIEAKGDFIVFKNEINSFELPNEVITRRRTVKIDFSCRFPKTVIISTFYNIHKSDYIFTESSFGSFGYSFEIFRDGNFTNPVDARAYPVEVKLLDTIFMGIEATSELPNLKLFVESCKATPDDNPENTLSYDLIKNGCLEDETVKVHPSNQTSFNFEVQAFKFTGNHDQVYITCSVILCKVDSPFSRCALGCLKNPSRRRRRSLGSETGSHYITQGPLQFVGAAAPNAASEDRVVMEKSDEHRTVSPPPVSPDVRSGGGDWEIRQFLNSNITAVVFATAFIVSVVLMAVMVRHFRKKRKEEDRSALIDSALES